MKSFWRVQNARPFIWKGFGRVSVFFPRIQQKDFIIHRDFFKKLLQWSASMAYNPNIHRLYVGYNPLILTIDPNFQQDIQACCAMLDQAIASLASVPESYVQDGFFRHMRHNDRGRFREISSLKSELMERETGWVGRLLCPKLCLFFFLVLNYAVFLFLC